MRVMFTGSYISCVDVNLVARGEKGVNSGCGT